MQACMYMNTHLYMHTHSHVRFAPHSKVKIWYNNFPQKEVTSWMALQKACEVLGESLQTSDSWYTPFPHMALRNTALTFYLKFLSKMTHPNLSNVFSHMTTVRMRVNVTVYSIRCYFTGSTDPNHKIACIIPGQVVTFLFPGFKIFFIFEISASIPMQWKWMEFLVFKALKSGTFVQI